MHLVFVLISGDTMPIKGPNLPLLGRRAVPYTVRLLILLHSQNLLCQRSLRISWWAGDEARENFLKELGIVNSEIESKWDKGKETLTFKVLMKYWERTFTEMPDVMLRALYISIFYLYIICRAPFLGLVHKQVASEKERETETERQRQREKKNKTECQTINKAYPIYS